MSRRAATVTQADIARVLRAVKAAGLPATVEVKPDGTILVSCGDKPKVAGTASEPVVEDGKEVVLW